MTDSRFKLLDSYAAEDKDAFFGRDDEVGQLYEMLRRSRLTLVYGPSGSGKSSLLQAGLAQRFPPHDWTPLFVRRRQNINAALRAAIARAALPPPPGEPPPGDLESAVESLYLDHLRPVYLIFDQFEELFLLGDAAEQAVFIESLVALVRSELSVRVVLSLREEYLARLGPIEKVLPELFKVRLRVEPMRTGQVLQVIEGTVSTHLRIPLEPGCAAAIDANLREGGELQLAYLQVYLDRLDREARKAGQVGFTCALVKEVGRLGDVLATFLDDQAGALQMRLQTARPALPDDAVQQVLEAHTTPEGTKAPRSREDLEARLPDAVLPALGEILAGLDEARVLRTTDGLTELAHDALVARIEGRRSADSKRLQELKKMIADRREAFEREKTYLNRRQLGLVVPYEAEVQRLLSDADREFLRRSRGAAARWQAALLGGLLTVAAVAGAALLAFGAWITQPTTAVDAAKALAEAGHPDLGLALIDAADRGFAPEGGNSYLKARVLDLARADIHAKSGRPALARQDFDRMRQRFRYSSEALNDLCWYEAQAAVNLRQAAIDCEEAVQRSDAIDSRAFLRLRLAKQADAEGRVDEAKKWREAALADYEKALRQRPADSKERAVTLWGRAVTRQQLGDVAGGRQDKDNASRLDKHVGRYFPD